jgi:hypothetical protein
MKPVPAEPSAASLGLPSSRSNMLLAMIPYIVSSSLSNLMMYSTLSFVSNPDNFTTVAVVLSELLDMLSL